MCNKTLIDTIVKMSGGRFVTITFTKANGDTRTVNGRLGVRYFGAPASPRMDSALKQYLLLWEVRSRGFRRIALDTIERVATQKTVIYTRVHKVRPGAARTAA
jgi:hypothetical protein